MAERRAKMRVEIRTPDGGEHAVEESLTDSETELMKTAQREPTTKNRMRLLDALVERGSGLVLRVAGTVSRGLHRKKRNERDEEP
jgi:hypothetical protein